MPRLRWTLLLFAGLCGSPLWGCSQLGWLRDHATPRNEPSQTLLPLASEADSGSQADSPQQRMGVKQDAKEPGRSQRDLLDGQLALARLCERRGENEQAGQMYRSLLEKAPQDPRPHHRLGVLAVQEREFAQAEEHFRVARSLAPPKADLLSDIGYCYYLQQKLTEAEDVLNAAQKLEPNHPAAINNLALVAGAQGRYGQALALFKRTSSEAQAYANLGYVLAQNGKLAQAEDMYRRALTLDNDLRVAAQAMLQVHKRSQSQAMLASGDSASAVYEHIASRRDRGPTDNAPLPPSAADPSKPSDASRTVKVSYSAPPDAEVASPTAGKQPPKQDEPQSVVP